MPSPRARIALPVIAVVLVVLALALYVGNEKATSFINGDGFRQMLDKATSKGMKFDAHYAPLRRVGLFTMATDSFHGDKGTKTIVSMDAQGITGTFNFLGIGLRHWEVDHLHINSGTVWLQKTQGTPGAPKGAPPIPWTALFWPYRLEMEDVKVDDAKVLFKLQDKESGLYHIFLEITPNGRDFEYDGKGGTFKTPMTPELNLEHVHLLIRKPRLYCPVFILGDDPAHPEHQMSITGDAGLQDDKSIQVHAKIDSLAVAPWLGEKMRSHVEGRMSGHLDYHSTGTGLESASGTGNISIADAVLRDLPIVKEYVKITASPDPGPLHLRVCQSDVKWEQGAISAENLQAECPGVFELSGEVHISKDKALSGTLHLGLTDPYLKWLPTARSAIFTKTDGDYRVAIVQLSGDMKKPQQDLTPRILKELGKSPFSALKLLFNAL